MITQGLYALISQDAGMSALIGGRVYPVILPEGPTLPAITYQVVSDSQRANFTTSGVQKMRIQLDCFGATYDDASIARDTLRKLLNGFQGPLADGTQVLNALKVQQIDFFDDDARQYRCLIEFYVWFNLSN